MKLALEHVLPLRSPTVAPEDLARESAKSIAEGPGASFGDHLGASLQQMEAVAFEADRSAEGMVTGEVDIHEAMIAMEKADLVLKLGSTVRNKLLDAYRQLSQMT